MSILSSTRQKYEPIHQKYAPYYPAIFFIGGFILDVLTLSRIDHWIPITQHTLVLILASRLLYWRTLEVHGQLTVAPRWQTLWSYNNEILHFLLGNLLSSFTLFYFRSSSLATSIFFMCLMSGLLIVNEWPRFRHARLQMKTGIFALCLFTYFSYIVPIILGFVGLTPLLIALALGMLIAWSTTQQLIHKGLEPLLARKAQLFPNLAVLSAILILYFLRWLPPLPLAAQYVGIYHNIERDQQHYRLIYERPWWKFWQNGAQTFLARQGDRIYCFARIFSPAHFEDDVIFHWLYKSPEEGWKTTDRLRVKVQGGRESGFRAWTSKSNYNEGQWRIQIETADGREMGRIYFDVEAHPEPDTPRDYREDLQ